MANPFGATFESLENPTGPVVESVHEIPYRRLVELIDSGEGQLISLRAPRAGYGKTMLLSRLREKKKSAMTIIPIHLADGRLVEGERILEEVLTQMAELVPGTAGLTKLDLHTRQLFAHGLLPMVYSGEVPSQDKQGALASLKERPTEAFDFHNEGAAIAQWTKSQFDVLSPRLSSVLGKASGVTTRDTSYWISRLFEFAIRPPSEPSRTGDLMSAVFGSGSRFRSGSGFLDGLSSLLNLITLVEPAVLVLDEVDGLSSDSDSALRATSSLVSLWESSPRVSVIISVNDDVWLSAFAPRLPLGLRDRLEDTVIRLKPLTADEARSLVKIRSSKDADLVLAGLDLDSDSLYPRGVLRAAREAWENRDSKELKAQVEFKKASSSLSPTGEAPLADFKAPQAAAAISGVSDALAAKKLEDEKALAAKKLEEEKALAAKKVEEEKALAAKKLEEEKTLAAKKLEEEKALAAKKVLEEKKNLPPKVNYPPPVVRRVAVPRAFNVERIRDTSAPIPTEAENTQGEKKLETSSAVTAAAALAASAELKKKAVSPSEDSVNEALAGLGQEKSAPFDIAASQAAEKDPKTSPFEVASSQDSSKGTASVDQPSPFTIADSKESVAEVKKEQVKSPFKVAASEDSVEVSKKEEVSSFAVASAQPTSADVRKAAQASPFAAASPLQSSEQAFAEPQTAIPAARVSEPKQEEEALSPFEAARPPSVAPNMPFSPSEGGRQQNVAAKQNVRSYPSQVPFEPAPVENQPTQATTPASQSPFQVREEPAQAVEKSPFTVRSESSQKKSEDPLRANLAPKAVPPQPEVPKADADAIDELLRQFREHRDS